MNVPRQLASTPGFSFLPLLALVAVVASCGRQPATPVAQIPEDAVASVNGAPIREAVFRELLNKRARLQPDKFASLEQKEGLLDELVRAEAVYAKALASGFDQRPEIAAAVKNLIAARFQEEQLKSPLKPVADDEARKFYEENRTRFTSPEAVNGAVIFLGASAKATGEKRAERRAEAEAVWQQVRVADEAAFRALAQARSEDPATRYRGGETGWLPRDDASWDAAVMEALFSLTNPGEVAPLVQTPRGFYVVKLLAKRDAVARPFAEVREAICYQIARQKEEQRQREFYAAMKEGLDIRINRALLGTISVPARNESPPQTPAGQTAQLQRQP